MVRELPDQYAFRLHPRPQGRLTSRVALLALSCISFVARGLNLGAEFTGGRAYVIRFDKPVSAEEVRQNLGQVFAQHADADASAISFEVKQYGNENQMRIVTQYRYDDTSDEATPKSSRSSTTP